MVRTRVAYWSELTVSSRLPSLGETLTNMSVLALPPSESDMSIVSLWLRYGMCACSEARAEMTSPSAERDELIACASFFCSPSLPDFFSLCSEVGKGAAHAMGYSAPASITQPSPNASGGAAESDAPK